MYLRAGRLYLQGMGIAEAGDQSAIGNQYVPRGRYYCPTALQPATASDNQSSGGTPIRKKQAVPG